MDRKLIYRIVRIRLTGIERELVRSDSDDFVVSRKVQCFNELWLDLMGDEGARMFPVPDEIIRRIECINDVRQLRRAST